MESSSYFDYQNNFKHLGPLDFSELNSKTDMNGTMVQIPTKEKLPNSDVPKGVFYYLFSGNSSKALSFVMDYSTAIVNVSFFKSGEYSLSFSNGLKLYSIEKKINNNIILKKEKGLREINYFDGKEKNTFPRVAEYDKCQLRFITMCYNEGVKSCEADPYCRVYCDFLPCKSLLLMDCALKSFKACDIID